jgi:threonine/homoserine/homoserine lactone efflux protein
MHEHVLSPGVLSGAEWSTLLLLAFATSFTPGPNTTLSTALAANRGLRGSIHFVLSVPVGWGLLFTLCVWGLGGLVLAVPVLRWGVLLGGVCYLLWLARRLWGAGALTEIDPSRMNVSFMQGVVLQFLNIKAWMLALSIVAGWVAGRPDLIARFAATLPVMLVFAFISNFTYALAGSLLRQWLAQGRRLRMFNRCMAAALVLTAGWMLTSAPI